MVAHLRDNEWMNSSDGTAQSIAYLKKIIRSKHSLLTRQNKPFDISVQISANGAAAE